MTIFNYVSEMHEFCFRVVQALSVLEKTGTKDFYSAAEAGFFKMLEELKEKPIAEVSKPINQDQLDTLISCKTFVENQEREASNKLSREHINRPYTDADKQAYDKIMKEMNLKPINA